MPGALDKATLFHSAVLFKDGILEVLKSGYANEMADVNVDAAVKEDCGPTISTIEDRFTFKTDGSATLGKPVRITGKLLRIAGEDDTGIFLSKLDENGAHSSAMQTWLKVSKIGTDDVLFRTSPKVVDV